MQKVKDCFVCCVDKMMNTTCRTNPRFLTEILLLDLRNSAEHRRAIQREMKQVSVFHKENKDNRFGFKILGKTFDNKEKEEEKCHKENFLKNWKSRI